MKVLLSRSRYCLAVVSLAAATLLLGCGYALVGRVSSIPEDIKDIYVAPMENRTQRAQLEQFLTQAITDELVTRRRFNLVGGQDGADAELHGTVKSFRVTPVTFDDDGRGQEYEISIVADVSFDRAGGDEVVWSNDSYLFKEIYEIDSSADDYFDQENVAILEASVRFAETMVSDLLEGF